MGTAEEWLKSRFRPHLVNVVPLCATNPGLGRTPRDTPGIAPGIRDPQVGNR